MSAQILGAAPCRAGHGAPHKDERSGAIPLAFSSFLCACRRRRFWLFSFTMSCTERSFAARSASSPNHATSHKQAPAPWDGREASTALPGRTRLPEPRRREPGSTAATPAG